MNCSELATFTSKAGLSLFCRQFEQLWLAGTLAKLVKCDGGFAWVDVQIGLGYQDKVNNLNVTTKLVVC